MTAAAEQHQVFIVMDRDGMFRPTCGCGWRGNGFDTHERAMDEGAKHGEVVR